MAFARPEWRKRYRCLRQTFGKTLCSTTETFIIDWRTVGQIQFIVGWKEQPSAVAGSTKIGRFFVAELQAVQDATAYPRFAQDHGTSRAKNAADNGRVSFP